MDLNICPLVLIMCFIRIDRLRIVSERTVLKTKGGSGGLVVNISDS